MTDQPNAVELLTAVHEFLTKHAMPELKGHTAFHARVAANVVAIVRRELERGVADDADERARLVTLLGETGDLETLNRLLCEAIQSRSMSHETPMLMDHLRETTLSKLAIDQPQYAAYRRAVASDGED